MLILLSVLTPIMESSFVSAGDNTNAEQFVVYKSQTVWRNRSMLGQQEEVETYEKV